MARKKDLRGGGQGRERGGGRGRERHGKNEIKGKRQSNTHT